MVKTKLYHDNFQNYKRYGIPRAQLVIADIPYNLGSNAYASKFHNEACKKMLKLDGQT